MLELRGINVKFGSVAALSGIDLCLATAGYAVIVGQSGSGKSTLLRCIAGLVAVDSGTISLEGRDLTPTPPHLRPVASVFQHIALFPHLTVAGNIAFGLEQQGLALRDIRQRVGEMLELVDLAGLDRRKPHELSGGQQQRVAIARALAVRPHVLMLDEPLGSLDPELRTAMRRELTRIQRESGVLFLHVSHDREDALTLADHLVVLHHGELVAADAMPVLQADPGTDLVAQVLGLDNALPHPAEAGKWLAFAPEHVRIGAGNRSGRITAEHRGGVWIQREIMLDTGEVILQREVATASDDQPRIGETVVFEIPGGAIKVVRRVGNGSVIVP